jgi:hypothetical protein
VTRGRGDAKLTFGDASPEIKEKLALEFLPRGKVANPESSELFGLSSSAPKVEPSASAPGSDRAAGDTDAGQVIRRRWTAGQRETVRNYFKE